MIDWGTTHRRIYRIEGGKVVESDRDRCGVASLRPQDYPEQLRAIRNQFGDHVVVMAGMVGSTIGWREVPYAWAPATLGDLAERALWIDARTAILPGISVDDGKRADVMRGEEIQIFGAIAAGSARPDAYFCQPGTHCKWVRAEAGRIVGLRTAMTGEMFALLKAHALIGREMEGEAGDDADFVAGVAASADGDLLGALFAVRPAALLGLRRPGTAASYVSGLLIGADVRAGVRGDAVMLLADPELGALYGRAIDLVGGRAQLIDSEAAFLSGMIALTRMIR